MKNIKQKEINPEQWYTLKDLQEQKLVAHIRKSLHGISKMVQADKMNRNLLKAAIIGRGTNTRYKIKGRNLIQFLVNWEDGSYQL